MQEAATESTVGAVSGEGPSFMERLFPGDGLLGRLFTLDTAIKALRVVLAIVVGLMIVALVVSILKRIVRKRSDARTGAVVIKVAQYLGVALIVVNAFEAAQVNLSALLGAAGIAGIALGFAAQTSISNFISGFFLVSEKTFAAGDVITVDTVTGTVHSVDSLSVKIRTFDNRLVRIPNETLIKTNVYNLTRFPVRRYNMSLTVLRDSDIAKVTDRLLAVALANQYVLRNPEPFFLVERLGQNGIEVFFGVWFTQDDWVQGINSIHEDVQNGLKDAGILLAYPTMTIEPPRAAALPEAAPRDAAKAAKRGQRRG